MATHILIFGDSITAGSWDRMGGWPDRIKVHLAEKYPQKQLVHNLGVSGELSDALLERFNRETEARLHPTRNIIIFGFGVNDAHSKEEGETPFIPEVKFREIIQTLIDQAKKFPAKIIFVGPTPIDEDKCLPWVESFFLKNKTIEKNNNIIKEICNGENIKFVEIYDPFTKSDFKGLLEDGLHPNTKGHKLIFEIVKDYLEKNKII